MVGSQVAKVIASKNDDFPVDCRVIGYFGWRTHTVVNIQTSGSVFRVRRLPDLKVPPSYFLGCMGLPGITAYYGLLELCDPQEGQTVVVTAAAGAVGSLVGQIAKIRGCKVVGIAGTDVKCEWIKSLGFDETINYKECPDLGAALKKAAPNGVDCYFDNVGGQTSHVIRSQMNEYGRIALCGSISQYNDHEGQESQVPTPEYTLISKQIRAEGFIASRWDKPDKWATFIQDCGKWMKEGNLKVKETVYQGFEKMPEAFIGVLRGKNIGKAIVNV